MRLNCLSKQKSFFLCVQALFIKPRILSIAYST